MMKSSIVRQSFLVVAALVLCLLFAGCGSTSSGPAPTNTTTTLNTPTKGQVSLFLKDAPVDGVVAFNVSVTNASLFDSGGTSYPLSISSREFEFRQLRLASDLGVSSASIDPATYSNLQVGLATPRLTIVGANGVVQQLTQTTTPSVTLTNSMINLPTSFSLAAGQSAGVMLDFDLASSLSVDSNGNFLITPTLSSATTTATGLPELSLTLVKVSAVQTASSTMDVQIVQTGDTVHVKVDGNTAFDPAVGQLSSVTTGEMLDLEAKFQSDGSYLAKYVNQGAPDPMMRFQGMLMDTNQSGASPLMEIVVR